MKTTGERFKYLANVLYDGNKSELARNLDIAPQSFSKYTGGNITPGGNILAKCYELGINTSWIVTGDGYPFDPHRLEADKKFKRLIILRELTFTFHGTPRIAAQELGVDLETYEKWEMGLEPIPDEIVDKIYDRVKGYVRKEWWYEGKGEMFINDPLKNYQPPGGMRHPTEGEEFGPEIPLDPSQLEPPAGQDKKWTQKDVDDFKELLNDFKRNPNIPREVMFEVIKLFIEDRSDNSKEEN